MKCVLFFVDRIKELCMYVCVEVERSGKKGERVRSKFGSSRPEDSGSVQVLLEKQACNKNEDVKGNEQ